MARVVTLTRVLQYFTQQQRESLTPSATSKKDAALRRKELLAILVDPLTDVLVAAAQEPVAADYGEVKPLNNKHSTNVIYECACSGGSDAAATRLFDAMRDMATTYTLALDFFHTSRLFKRYALRGEAHVRFCSRCAVSSTRPRRTRLRRIVASRSICGTRS